MAMAYLRVQGARALGDVLEAARTVGIVLAVLLLTDLHQVPVWICMSLMFAPAMWDAVVLVCAAALSAWRERSRR